MEYGILRRFFWKVSKCFFGRLALKNVDVRVYGLFPDPPFIVVSNHDHPWDPTLLCYSVYDKTGKTMHFFAGKFLFRGLRKLYLNLVEQIPVQSGSYNLNNEALERAGKYLKSGNIVGIFPYPFDVVKKRRVLYTGVTRLFQNYNFPYLPVKIKVKEKWKWGSYYDKNFDYVEIFIGKLQKNTLYKKKLNKRQALKQTNKILRMINNI